MAGLSVTSSDPCHPPPKPTENSPLTTPRLHVWPKRDKERERLKTRQLHLVKMGEKEESTREREGPPSLTVQDVTERKESDVIFLTLCVSVGGGGLCG